MGDAASIDGQLSLGAVATRGTSWPIGQQVMSSKARSGQGGTTVLAAARVASSYSHRICIGFKVWKGGFACDRGILRLCLGWVADVSRPRSLLALQLKEQGSIPRGMLFDYAACHCELCQ